MKLYIDARLAKDIIERDFGGMAGFADAWAGRDAQLGRKAPLARDGKTIYGWLADGLPKRRETVFDFFAMLDVDPVAILDLERNGFPESFGRLRLSFLLGGAAAGAFRPLFELYRPGPAWPDSEIADRFFDRGWTVRDFVHSADPVANRYATIHVRWNEAPARPAAWHIAYRRVLNNDAMWRPYGTVIVRDAMRILIHENGFTQQEAVTPEQPDLRFQTFFGPSDVQFRLASLTPFDIGIDFPDDSEGLLRFIG
jgi:hypothetical protein